MLKIIPALLILCTLCKFSFAQDITVRILLKNEKNEAVPGATIKIYSEKDSLLSEKILLPATSFSLRADRAYLFMITAASIAPLEKRMLLGNKDTTVVITALP